MRLTVRAVSFDFHNTLATCDAWFEVEVRTLVSDLLRWHARDSGRARSDVTLADAERRYRTLRREVLDGGVEQDAHACARRVLDDLDWPIDEKLLALGVERIMRATLDGAAPLPGAVESVRALSELGLPLAVVSSAVYHPFLEWTLARFGILEAFEFVVTSASCGFYKSRPEIYVHTLDAFGIAPCQLVHIGDSLEYDVTTAGKLGIRTVWLNAEDVADHPADLRVESLHGLAPVLLECFG